jgi:cytochrome c-type biogenesis protein CcmH
MKTILIALFFLSSFAWVGAPVHAQTPTPSADAVNKIAKELYCPTCANVPLDQCGTQACADWREEIRRLLAEGKTEAEIRAYFVAQHGERVLSAPRPQGINLLLWLLPVVALLAFSLVWFGIFRRTPSPAPTSPVTPSTPISDKYSEQIENELKKM